MKSASFFRNKIVKDQYGNFLTVLHIEQNSVQVLEDNIHYHTTKLYFQGKSLYTLLTTVL